MEHGVRVEIDVAARGGARRTLPGGAVRDRARGVRGGDPQGPPTLFSVHAAQAAPNSVEVTIHDNAPSRATSPLDRGAEERGRGTRRRPLRRLRRRRQTMRLQLPRTPRRTRRSGSGEDRALAASPGSGDGAIFVTRSISRPARSRAHRRNVSVALLKFVSRSSSETKMRCPSAIARTLAPRSIPRRRDRERAPGRGRSSSRPWRCRRRRRCRPEPVDRGAVLAERHVRRCRSQAAYRVRDGGGHVHGDPRLRRRPRTAAPSPRRRFRPQPAPPDHVGSGPAAVAVRQRLLVQHVPGPSVRSRAIALRQVVLRPRHRGGRDVAPVVGEDTGPAPVELRRADEVVLADPRGRRGKGAAVELVDPDGERSSAGAGEIERRTVAAHGFARSSRPCSSQSRFANPPQAEHRAATARRQAAASPARRRRASSAVSARGSYRRPTVRGYPVSVQTGSAPSDSSHARPSSSRSRRAAAAPRRPPGTRYGSRPTRGAARTTPLDSSIERLRACPSRSRAAAGPARAHARRPRDRPSPRRRRSTQVSENVGLCSTYSMRTASGPRRKTA